MTIFNPRVFPEIVGDMISRLIAVTPLTDINFGSVWTSMLEAAAQEDDEQYFQMLEIIRGYSLDTTTGTDLEDRAFEYGLTRITAQTASTKVTLGDSGFTKISTGVYSGLPGAPAGDFTVNGDSATDFPISGAIVIGRGTANTETVAYSSITDNGNYVTFNLSIALGLDHGTDESIVLAQGGNRTIAAGTVVMVPASDLSPQIDFTTQDTAVILDGEVEVLGVSAVATQPGSVANVPVGAISLYDSQPFSTATVRNLQRVTNGKDDETDQELRDRIKAHIQSLSRGTGKSIITGVIGILSEAENKRVVSASLIEPTLPADVVKLFIDDGTGFVPTFLDVGYEEILTLATGGEKFLKSHNFPIMKAFVETQNEEPYNIAVGEDLTVEVGGKVETITFAIGDFAIAGAGTAQEVLRKINATAAGFESRVSSGGVKLRIFSRTNSDEQIRVTGGSANAALNFPLDLKYTTKLYLKRNNQVMLLTKDGTTASLECANPEGYDLSDINHNFCLVVDGKIANANYVDFKVSELANPASVTAEEVIAIMNTQMAGALATISSNQTKITLTSNVKRSLGSQLQIVENFTAAFKYNGSYTDMTDDVQDAGVNNILFVANGDDVFVGHSLLPFETIYVSLATPASSAMAFDLAFWDGTGWKDVGYFDGTEGFTQDGIIRFKAPFWLQNVVNSVTAYFVRIRRNQTVLATTPTESLIKVCSANQFFGFSELAVMGANKDYTLNRFIGQIELETPLQAGDSLAFGSFDTRATLASTQGSFALFGGETLDIEIDGEAQAVTFLSGDFFDPGFASVQEVAIKLNVALTGILAMVIDSGTKVQIISNKWNGGTLQVTGGTANAVLQFGTDLVEALVPHVPAVESGSAEPYAFPPAASIIVVMDENAANNFTLPCGKVGTLTGAASTTSVADSTLSSTFPLAGNIQGMDFHLTSRYAVLIQDIQYISNNVNRAFITIAYVTGGTAGAEVVTVTGAVISVAIESGVSTATQVKAAIDASGAATALLSATILGTASNPQTAVAATALVSPRRTIASYVPVSGTLNLGAALPFSPVVGDTYEVTPIDAEGIVRFWNNKQITLLSTNAEIRVSSGGTKVQIASLAAGEDASVQITGGTGNTILNFPVATKIGIDGYRHYSGLAQETQWVVDGKVDDPDNYPGIRAAGVQVEVAESVTIPISVELDVTSREGISLSSIANDVKSAVSAYINTLKVGDDVIISDIIHDVKNVQGVFDVRVTSPTANVAIADNELARVNEQQIIVG